MGTRASRCPCNHWRGPAGKSRCQAPAWCRTRPRVRNFWRIRACAGPVRSRTTPPLPPWKPWPVCGRSACRQNLPARCRRLPAIRLTCNTPAAFTMKTLKKSGHGQSARFSRKPFMPLRQVMLPRCSKMLCWPIRWWAIHSAFLHGSGARRGLAGGKSRGRVPAVIGAEETNWITADALRHLDRPAGCRRRRGRACVCAAIQNCRPVSNWPPSPIRTHFQPRLNTMRAQAAQVMRGQLDPITFFQGNCFVRRHRRSVRVPMRRNAPPGAIGTARAAQPEAHFGRRPDGRRCLAMRGGVRCRGRRTDLRRPMSAWLASNQQAVGARFVR